jgi:hypothetical protein
MTSNVQSISVDRIFLDLENPRHKPYKSEEEVIEYLCRYESVYALAKDMSEIGLNPLESFALISLDINKKITKTTPFVVAEGNRRMCAIKLLNDPDLAPTKLRKDFLKLAEDSVHTFSAVPAIIFKDGTEVDVWLERIHGGPQGGIGRKPWNAEQKTRHLGDRKNALAQSILDYSEQSGYISSEERKGKLTTAQRYLGNSVLREAIGIDSDIPGTISRTRPSEDVALLLKSFMRDLVDGTVHSRSTSDDIKNYARDLSSSKNISGTRVAAVSLGPPSSAKKRKPTPKEPRRPKSISYEQDIAQELKNLGNYKLQNLYFSICEVGLEKHTPLVSVGAWSFMETLTARCGRVAATDFVSFLSHDRLNSLGFTAKDHRKTLIQAIHHISEYGNTTKHSDTAANFNGMQLANDMDTLKDLIVSLIKVAKH